MSYLEIIGSRSLQRSEAGGFLNGYLTGEISQTDAEAVIRAISARGETVAELLGFADIIGKATEQIELDDPNAIDVCGTGGGTNIFNVSTATAFVVSGCGVTVAKLGNKTVIGTSGSADVLEMLGVRLTLTPTQVRNCVNKIGVGFLFAPMFCPRLASVRSLRQQLRQKSIFHMVGPLINPANLQRQLIGAWDKPAAECIADAIVDSRTTVKVCVISAEEGLDEVSLETETTVIELSGSAKAVYGLNHRSFDLPTQTTAQFTGATPQANAALIQRILSGAKIPERDLILANAAIALKVAGKISQLADGVAMAAEAIDSGRAAKKLQLLCEYTNQER